MFSTDESRKYYDAFGARQDRELRYEAAAFRLLADSMDLRNASCVCELGCGTGALAQQILSTSMRHDAVYLGLDISSTMTRLAAERLSAFADRALIVQTDGASLLPCRSGSVDRFLATYVFDLLPESHVH